MEDPIVRKWFGYEESWILICKKELYVPISRLLYEVDSEEGRVFKSLEGARKKAF